MASGNHKFQSGLLDLLAMQMDSSHATGLVCFCTKGLYAHEVMMVRGNACATSLSTQVARAFCSLCTECNVYTHTDMHTHTHTHTHTCTHAHTHTLRWSSVSSVSPPSPNILQHS